MSKSSKRASAADAPGFWERTRRLLHAFAQAGQTSTTGLQLFVGPNGGPIWTDAAQVDRSEPCAAAGFPTTETSVAPEVKQSPVIVRPQEPAGSRGYTPLEAPAPN
jgi:hypothetical protein